MTKLSAWLVAGLVQAGLVLPALAADIELRLAHVTSESSPIQAAALEYARRVSERTNGAVEISVFAGAQLGSNAEVYEQVNLGAPIIQIADPGYLSDYAPDFGVLAGPYLMSDPNDFSKLLESDLYAGMKDKVRESGNFEVLTMNWLYGARHIISNRPVKDMNSTDGLAIRVPPNTMWIETFKAMGADGIQIAWSEVYTGLSSGVVDAAEAPLSAIVGAKLYENAKHISLTGHFNAFIGPIMNAELFASYPENVQAALIEESVAAGEFMTKMVMESDGEYRDQLEAEGVAFHEDVDIAGFQAATTSVYEQFPGWTPGLYDQVRAILDK